MAHGLPGSYVAASQCGPCSQEGRLEAIESLARRVVEGHDVRLSCHCFPRACHGGVIAAQVRVRASELHVRKRRR